MPSSRRLTASNPPQDVPITMSSYTSRDFAVDPFVRVDLFVTVCEPCEPDRLLVPEREHPERREALVEQAVHVILERLVEVDHHVATDDHVELVEAAIHREVVLCEDDVLGERTREAHMVVRGDVVAREVALAAAADV